MKQFIILFSISLLIFGCTENRYKMHLSNLEKYGYIKNTTWTKVNSYLDKDEEYYYLQNIKNDTFKYFSFYYYPKNNRYYVLEQVVRYLNNDTIYETALSKEDTLYFYKQIHKTRDLLEPASTSIEDKIFISGKYYYLNLYGKLSTKQQEFFLEYKDSLTKLKGNTLQELPEL